MNWKLGIIVGAAGLMAGCFTPDPKSLKSDFAENKIPAIKDAAARNDQSAIPLLVKNLDDNDPAVRLATINALQQMTGQTFDYQYYDDADERKPAVARWQHWLKHR